MRRLSYDRWTILEFRTPSAAPAECTSLIKSAFVETCSFFIALARRSCTVRVLTSKRAAINLSVSPVAVDSATLSSCGSSARRSEVAVDWARPLGWQIAGFAAPWLRSREVLK